jgi:hypothetical protein
VLAAFLLLMKWAVPVFAASVTMTPAPVWPWPAQASPHRVPPTLERIAASITATASSSQLGAGVLSLIPATWGRHPSRRHPALDSRPITSSASAANASGFVQTALSKVTWRPPLAFDHALTRRVTPDRVLSFIVS